MTYPVGRLDHMLPFQVVIYSGFVAGGVHGLALGAPPNAVSQAMGHGVALVWTIMLIVCPLVAFGGMGWRRNPAGAWLQIGGAAGIGLTSAAYATAVLGATWLERATLAAWMAIAITTCAFMVVARDVRRWRLVTQLAREIGGDDD